MSAKVYYLNSEAETTDDRENANIQIPSVEYLKEYIESISSLLQSHYGNTESHIKSDEYNGVPTVQCDLSALPVGIESEDTHAEYVKQDARHLFVTKVQLEEFKDKPTQAEMAIALDSMAATLENNYKTLYTNMLNMPDAISKLKNIATLVKSDDTLEGLVDLMVSKADAEDLENHANSIYHLTVEDREALNLLLKFAEVGCADWNADETSLAFIKNKPEALKANGGNADTVGNLPLSSVVNKREYDLYIGNTKYDKNDVDMVVCGDDSKDLTLAISGSILFRKGSYNLNSLKFNDANNSMIITGTGKLTKISSEEAITFQKELTVKDICFCNSDIYIGSSNDIHNVIFENCNVYFATVSNTNLEGCTFTGSTFTFKGSCVNNMIIHNRANSDIKFTYKGGNNIIDANLSC